MKLVILTLAAVAALGGQTPTVLKVTTLAANPTAPVAFAQVEVQTPKGKKVASGFASASGLAEFSLPAGEYVVTAKSVSVSQCGTQSRGTVTSLCAGQTRVSLTAGAGTTEASVVIRPGAKLAP